MTTYNNLGGVYFPILQQDKQTRVLVKVANGKDVASLTMLQYLREKDR